MLKPEAPNIGADGKMVKLTSALNGKICKIGKTDRAEMVKC